MTQRKGTLRLILKIIGLVFLSFAVLGVVFYGPILGWAFYTDVKNEQIAREIIDPKAAVYLQEHYPGNDFEVQESYNVFKDNCFRVRIQSRSSQDTHFYLDYDHKSYELTRDTYEDAVLGGWNTRDRLTEAYDAAVRESLEGMDGLFRLTTGLCKYDESPTRNLHFSPDGLDPKTLILDGEYDICAIGEAYGYLDVTFLVEEAENGLEQACERLLELDRVLTEQGVGYHVMEVILQSGEYPDITSRFYLYGVQKEDLLAEDVAAHLQQMWDEQEAQRESDG